VGRGRRSRVTRLGKLSFAAAASTKLPQLIMFLRGDMRLVGPRPERPVLVAMLTGTIPFYSSGDSVKPGITVGRRCATPTAGHRQSMKSVEYDLYYVKNIRCSSTFSFSWGRSVWFSLAKVPLGSLSDRL